MLLLKLGYRNLWRNRRRTLLTMSAMAVATALLILTLGIYDGMLWDMVEGATELYHGHVKITTENYMENRQIYQTIPEDGIYKNIAANPQVKELPEEFVDMHFSVSVKVSLPILSQQNSLGLIRLKSDL